MSSENDEKTVIIERNNNDIVTVVLNRPHKLNAFTRSMWGRMGEVFRELNSDDTIRCIIIRGAGERAFGPGNDISEFKTERNNGDQAKVYGELMHETIQALRALRHPTVAMIHGICVGGGLEIAGLCDIRVCGESSKFGAPIAKLGLVMAYQEISCLKDLIGHQGALEVLLEARTMNAKEAEQRGIVSRVTRDEDVESEAIATAERIAAGAPLVHRWHKKFLNRLRDARPLTKAELDEGFDCYDTEDFQTGYNAFLNKETPLFKGK
ncbi:MAG: enoyl-CoA hydratase [Rhodospirillaceae bacterium TMED8]|nr:enoyl-CoA hydratase [Magnetovibrio sp.]OUT47780.1 MAG: enoyl-CoA hydratase [Rhodospirillaceae bacterium TMED8]|tara:strand:- start:167 stop:964 length:798 start_codon:yes stop_codon:yes gene_type:complete